MCALPVTAVSVQTETRASAPAENSRSLQPVWDLPVRLGHGLFILLIPLCWWTAENQQIAYHRYAGFGLFGVLVFRVYWGFAGSSTARFAAFVRSPVATWRYLQTQLYSAKKPRLASSAKGSAPVTTVNPDARDTTLSDTRDCDTVGHNPLGAWSVLVLLALMLLQVGLGLFAVDVDGFEGGPFSYYLSFDDSRLFARWHGYLFYLLLGFIALHIIAVMLYWLLQRNNLVATMIHGKAPALPVQALRPAGLLRLVCGLLLAAAAVYLLVLFS